MCSYHSEALHMISFHQPYDRLQNAVFSFSVFVNFLSKKQPLPVIILREYQPPHELLREYQLHMNKT
jgi:hypothetical protein